MAFEIHAEEDDPYDRSSYVVDSEAQKNKFRQIIKYQKCLFDSASSSSLSSSSSSLFSSPRRRIQLLDLMKTGSTSLGRLFDMEHTSLKTFLNEYSGSPMIKPIFLWGSDTEDQKQIYDPWMLMKKAQSINDCRNEVVFSDECRKRSNRRLTRKKSYRRLPRSFRLWFLSGFRFKFKFRFRLKRLRIMICGRKF